MGRPCFSGGRAGGVTRVGNMSLPIIADLMNRQFRLSRDRRSALRQQLSRARAGHTTPIQPETQFDVFEYRVLGNTVLPTQAVERAVYPHLGEKRTLKDVDAARVALEKAYRDARLRHRVRRHSRAGRRQGHRASEGDRGKAGSRARREREVFFRVATFAKRCPPQRRTPCRRFRNCRSRSRH